MKANLTIIAILILRGSQPAFPQRTSPGAPGNDHFVQSNLDNYVDVAKNNVADGTMARFGSLSTIKIRDWIVRGGFQWSWPSRDKLRFSAWSVDASRNFRVKKIPFQAGVFYRKHLISNDLSQADIGLYLGYQGRHFSLKLGNNYRIYKFSKKGYAEKGLNEESGSCITEPRNLMYSLSYSVKPAGHKWNAAVTITNIDHFVIQQETNPMIEGDFRVRLNSRLAAYTELWYQSAGLLNLQVNTFGFHFRTGVIWKIN